MTENRFGLKGVNASIELGNGKTGSYGAQIVSTTAGSLEFRDRDGVLTVAKGAPAVASSDLVVKSQLDTKQEALLEGVGIDIAADNTISVLIRDLIQEGAGIDITDIGNGRIQIAAGSLAVSSVTTSTAVSLAAFLASYTGPALESGDVVMLPQATGGGESWIHAGTSNGDETDYIRISADMTEAEIRSKFSAGAGITYDSLTGEISISAGAIVTSMLADASVTNAKLAADAVDASKIADAAIQAEHYADNSLPMTAIADGSIPTAKIEDGAITNSKLSTSLQGRLTGLEQTSTQVLKEAFAAATFNDSSVNIGEALGTGTRFKRVHVLVKTSFDDPTATIQIGTAANPSLLLSSDLVDLTDGDALFEVGLVYTLVTPSQIVATVSAGASTQGVVDVSFEYH